MLDESPYLSHTVRSVENYACRKVRKREHKLLGKVEALCESLSSPEAGLLACSSATYWTARTKRAQRSAACPLPTSACTDPERKHEVCLAPGELVFLLLLMSGLEQLQVADDLLEALETLVQLSCVATQTTFRARLICCPRASHCSDYASRLSNYASRSKLCRLET